MMRRHRANRGVVLLIVLTLLTLLVVIGLTFALISGQFRRAAEVAALNELHGDPPKKLLDQALYQILRDTENPNSVLRTHSLLRDMYGESIRGVQQGNSAQVLGQWMQFTARIPTNVNSPVLTNGFLNGCVLTFVTGNVANLSTRIAGYTCDVNTAADTDGDGVADQVNATFRVLLPTRKDGNIAISLNGDEFVVNGRPFSGTGSGFDPTLPSGLNSVQTINAVDYPHALLPNRVGEAPNFTATRYLQGGMHESYDAADYQNMLLSAIVRDAGGGIDVMPSLHRIALLNYWRNHTSGIWTPSGTPADNFYRQFRKGVIMRPTPWDHPNFTGGNPLLAAAAWDPGVDGGWGVAGTDDDGNGVADDITEQGWPDTDDILTNDVALLNRLSNPGNVDIDGDGNPDPPVWDIDNDGDGRPDSLWVDLGLPIQTDESGRRYKPLFAILCTDMDGKLNLNAHGDTSHIAVLSANQTVPAPVTLPGAVSTALAPGQGYGPPEISLRPILTTDAEYQYLLEGNSALGIPGRYGIDAVPGDATVQTLMQLKLFNFPPVPAATPTNYFLPATPLASFSSPYDLRGELAFGLDYRGMPLYERPTELNVVGNSAYELNLSGHQSSGLAETAVDDMPFTRAELERLLRANDADSYSLPSRLWHLVDAFRNSSSRRRSITTDSFDLPAPGISPLDDMLAEISAVGTARPRSLLDMVKVKLLQTRGLTASNLIPPDPNAATNATRLNNDLALLLPTEVIMGQRFDVNRPFGNGRDDPSPVTGNPNFVVDDHGVGGAGMARGEEVSNENVWGVVPFDHDNDGVVGAADTDAFRARHLYAKHLYVLMMALKPNTLQIDFDGDATNDSARETAHGIAQWAINVVDFRDSDAIMTPFEFDIFPFNDNGATAYGWDVDGILNTADDANPVERGLVWGCERPELLISEVTAFHDRRTEDRNVPSGQIDPSGMDPTADPNFDQRLMPRGSFFLELYNPWASDQRTPAEFYYNQTAGAWTQGVLLNQVTPGGSPVWRVIIAKGANQDLDPDHWDQTQRMPLGAISRSIYFTPFAGPVSGAEQPYFTDLPVAPILPGRYALIGSAGQSIDEGGNPLDMDGDSNQDYATMIGRRTTAIEDGAGGLSYGTTRRIVLEPNANANIHSAQVFDNQSIPPDPTVPDIQPAVGIVINQPRSFNVSEPAMGYPTYGVAPLGPGPSGEIWDPMGADYEGAYNPPLDNPLDSDPELIQDGTTSDFCMVHLQRLANPLLPHHPILNPYMTIDSMSSDMTAFNGVTSDMDPDASGGQPLAFHTRERGRDAGAVERELWKHERGPLEGGPAAPAATPEVTPAHHFGYVLGHTFNYLNRDYWPYFTLATAPAPTAFPPPLPNHPPNHYVGAPVPDLANPIRQMFPWLTWNNRPFVSQYELMIVPKSRSSRLPHEFSLTPPPGSPYAPGTPDRFSHMLNFFQTTDNAAPPQLGNSFYRLFEYTHVPSRFVDTELYLNPNFFTGAAVGTEFFHPPFNRISRYREPGRINLNTIFDTRVWTGLWAGHTGPAWQNFVTNRRGAGAVSPDILDLDDDIPTFFASPYRAVGSGLLVPPTSPTNPSDQLDRLDIECTMLRSDNVGYTNAPTNSLYANFSTTAYNNTDRNPYFRYQGLSRLGNLVTTRSNVYAVWMTVGFFEVEADPASGTPSGLTAHPDGYRLGKELGSDTGQVKRHRAFYMIDRSVPVAFEPGQNHNSNRAIVLDRYIE